MPLSYHAFFKSSPSAQLAPELNKTNDAGCRPSSGRQSKQFALAPPVPMKERAKCDLARPKAGLAFEASCLLCRRVRADFCRQKNHACSGVVKLFAKAQAWIKIHAHRRMLDSLLCKTEMRLQSTVLYPDPPRIRTRTRQTISEGL